MRFTKRRWYVVGAVAALVLMLGLGAIVALRAGPLELDAEWMEEIIEHRSPWWLVPSLVMNFLGGGWFAIFVVPIGIAVALFVLRRPWDAFYFLSATVVSAGLVQLLKWLVGRARPEDILVHVDPGSFPSGHVANAATLAVALGFIFPRVWVWVCGAVYVVLMALSRTYLGAHWVTDTIGGALLGGAVAVLLWAAFRLPRAPATRAESVDDELDRDGYSRNG